ncbi:MAG: hypothetical protein IT252_02415 [Chitinophagaceae bacterium]|nr:hypothetical protein [Chitinophagaceae bacterium]
MIKIIISWIDQKLENISEESIFKRYFENQSMMKGEDVFYLTNKAQGIEIVLSNSMVVTSIHLFSGENKNYQMFAGNLPFNIKFSFGRDEIHDIFGPPVKSGGGHKALYIGYIPFWEKYYFEGYSLHFEYSDECVFIKTVTLTSLNLEEYFNSHLQ